MTPSYLAALKARADSTSGGEKAPKARCPCSRARMTPFNLEPVSAISSPRAQHVNKHCRFFSAAATGYDQRMSNQSGGPVAASVVADLAAASRILAAQGVVDGFGHVSMRHPSASDRYLMARSIAPALVTPDDIVEYDLESNAINAGGRGSFLERFIHGEVYKARPDIQSVVHSHSPSVIPFGLVRVPMRAMFHSAAFLAAGVPV